MNEISLEYDKRHLVSQHEHLEKENLQINNENNHLVENHFQNIEYTVEQIIKNLSQNLNHIQNSSDDFLKNMASKK